jgi:hypothetical protein
MTVFCARSTSSMGMRPRLSGVSAGPPTDRPVEERAGLRCAEQGADAHAARRLAEDRDVVGVAAEALDVVAHPAERRDLVAQAEVRGAGQGVARQQAQMREAHRPEPVVDRDDHGVAAPGQLVAGVDRGGAGAHQEAASVDPDEDRAPVGIQARGEDVQGEAVVSDASGGCVDEREHGHRELRRHLARPRRVPHTGPRGGGLGRLEAPRTDQRRGVGDGTEGMDLPLESALEPSGSRIDDATHRAPWSSCHLLNVAPPARRVTEP